MKRLRKDWRLYSENKESTNSSLLNTCKSSIFSPTPIYFIGISDQMKIPVKYIGVGERMEDLQVFNKEEFVDSLFSE